MDKTMISMKKGEVIFGLCYIAIYLIVLPLLLSFLNLALRSPLSLAEINFICYAINFIVLTVVHYKFIFASAKAISQGFLRFLGITVSAFSLYWVSSILVNLFVYVLDPEFSNVNDESILGMLADSPELMWIGTVLLAPISEELMFRGAVFGGLYRRSKVAAYIVTITVFGLLHVIGYVGLYSPYRLFLCFLQYIPAGFFLNWAYARSKTILCPVLIHIANNFIAMTLM